MQVRRQDTLLGQYGPFFVQTASVLIMGLPGAVFVSKRRASLWTVDLWQSGFSKSTMIEIMYGVAISVLSMQVTGE